MHSESLQIRRNGSAERARPPPLGRAFWRRGGSFRAIMPPKSADRRRGGAARPHTHSHLRTLGKEHARRHLCASPSIPILRIRFDIDIPPYFRGGGVGASPGAMGKAGAGLTPGRPHHWGPTCAAAPNTRISDPLDRDSVRDYEASRRRRGTLNFI